MSLDLRKHVAVVGVGCTQFGELYEQSAEDLLCDAVDEALADAGCARERIEAAWVGTVMSPFGGDGPRGPAGMYDVVLAVGFEKMRDGGFGRPNRSHPVLDFGERVHLYGESQA